MTLKRTLPSRLVGAALRMLRAMPAALEREHLRWALREIDPMHPDVPFVIRRIRELEAK